MSKKASEVPGSETGLEQDPTLNSDPANPNLNPDTVQDGSVDTAAAPSFRNPALAGKTPEEIEAMFALRENTIKEQGRLLNRQVAAPEVVKEPEVVVPTKEEYWENPGAATTNILKQMIGPLRDELRKEIRGTAQEFRAPGIREGLRNKYKHFTELEPVIDTLLQQRGIDPKDADAQTTEQLYFAAKGYAMENGLLTAAPAARGDDPVAIKEPASHGGQAIPQHRPSAAPTPRAPASATAIRELDENERRLAREMYPNMPDAQRFKLYIDWQEEDVEKIVSSKIGQEAAS